jgi:hypothetical protein
MRNKISFAHGNKPEKKFERVKIQLNYEYSRRFVAINYVVKNTNAVFYLIGTGYFQKGDR